jgi:3-methyladenine DNA glycosylase AlkC
MFKEFFIRKTIEKQMKDVPKEEQDKMIELVSQNPELFQKMALEIKAEMDKGKDQMTATMEAGKRHEEELKKLIQ